MERWKINLYILWFSQIISLMSFGFGFPFLPYYIQELGVTDPDDVKMYTGVLSSVCGIATGIAAPLWGMMADRWGRKLMLMRAVLCASLIIAGMGLATRVEHLVLLRLAQGFFTGTVSAASILVAANTPKNRLSYALGFLSSSTFIGFSIGPAIGGFIVEFVGYRTSFFLGGLMMLLDFFLVLFFVKEENPVVPGEKQKSSSKTPLKEILSPFIIIMLFTMLFNVFAGNSFNPYIPLHVQELRSQLGGAAKIAGIVSGIIGFCTAMSGIVLGRLGDRYDKVFLIKYAISAGAFISLPLFFVDSLWLFVVFYALLYLFIGGIEPLITSLNSLTIPSEKRGTLFGIQGFVSSIGWGLAPILSGAVSIRYSLRTVLLLIPLFLMFSLGATFLYSRKRQL